MIINYRALLLILLAFTSMQVKAQSIKSYRLLNTVVKEFNKAEWDINLSAAYLNPYDQQDISLDMILTSPSGKPLVLPCYFENGTPAASAWKARFTPQETGVYTYQFGLKAKGVNEETSKGTFSVQSSRRKGFLHKNDLWTFRFDNGELFRGIGENVAWESRSFEDQKFTYDYLLPKLSKNGANFFRTWMCYWNMPLEWQKVRSTKRYVNTREYFNPGAVQKMDHLVQLTDSLGIYFMLTLDWHGHLMEEGGWKNSSYNLINGGPAKTPTDFFSMTAAKNKYKNKLRYVIARWGYSSNIAAIEFFNEVDNAVFNKQDSILIPHQYVTQWHDDMSRYLKEIDPYHHLVTTSVSHRDIAGMNSLAYLDVNQKHIYKHTEKIPAIYPDYIAAYHKPYIIGEFGLRWEDDDPKYAKEAVFDFKRGLWFGLFSPTPVLPMSWWWELFDDERMAPYFKGISMISDQMLKAGNGKFEQVEVKTNQLHAQAVKCGEVYFIYLLNNTDHQIHSPVSIPGISLSKISLQSFDPATLKINLLMGYQAGDRKLTVKNITLAAEQEMVIMISAK